MAQRNAALDYIEQNRISGVIYFMDDDNSYNPKVGFRVCGSANRCRHASRQAGRRAGGWVSGRAGLRAGGWSDRQASRQVGRQAGRQVDRHAGRRTCRLSGMLVDGHAGRQAGWLASR